MNKLATWFGISTKYGRDSELPAASDLHMYQNILHKCGNESETALTDDSIDPGSLPYAVNDFPGQDCSLLKKALHMDSWSPVCCDEKL